jgi:hypothetical protein
VQELLVCFLFFGGLFVALVLVIGGSMLVWYAGKCAFHWARSPVQVAPTVLNDPGEFYLDANPGPV